MTTATPYLHPDEIASVVHKFENCEFQNSEFSHAFHLTVAAWYLSHYSPEESLDRMRAALLRFTQHHGVKGYHETITRFWLLLTADFLNPAPASSSFTDRVNQLLQRFGRKDLLFDYYTRDRVMCDEARSGWVEPDLQTLRIHEPPVSTKS
jgi:hypothetical protein